MIEGARPIYHNASFSYEFFHAEMLLWTIIGKDVYMERNPHASINANTYQIDWWHHYISQMMEHPEFPDKI